MSATQNGRMSRHGSYLGSPSRPYQSTLAQEQSLAAAASARRLIAKGDACPHGKRMQDSISRATLTRQAGRD